MRVKFFFMRFKYYEKSQAIKDNETGYIYHSNNKRLCDLLNKLNEGGKEIDG